MILNYPETEEEIAIRIREERKEKTLRRIKYDTLTYFEYMLGI